MTADRWWGLWVIGLAVLFWLQPLRPLAPAALGPTTGKGASPAGLPSPVGELVQSILDRLHQWRQGRRHGAHVARMCSAVAAELKSGLPAPEALTRACHLYPAAPRAAAAARLNGDIPAAMRQDAALLGSPELAGLAACWSVADHTGAGLARGCDRIAEVARTHKQLDADLAQELAAPRATAKVLSLLPVVGLGLGQLLGAQPLVFLLGTSLGLACTTGGALLVTGGVVWSRRIADAALPQSSPGLTKGNVG